MYYGERQRVDYGPVWNMAAKDLGLVSDAYTVSETRKIFSRKILWLIPNFECNRQQNACRICFAANLMYAAKRDGYTKPDGNYLEKARVVSELPWKEVILTGGEPTMDPKALGQTLAAIAPGKKIRIITNGDWALNDERIEEVSRALRQANRPQSLQVDISAHDSIEVLLKKIDAIRRRTSVSIGVQLREDETEYEEKLKALKILPYVAVETHRAIRIGKAVETAQRGQESVPIKLTKLIAYTYPERNVGAYLIRGPRGTRFIVNHETPYLVDRTPADIASPRDSAMDIVKKAIAYYKLAAGYYPESYNAGSPFSYAIAAFRSGTPVELDSDDLFEERDRKEEKLFNDYCHTIAIRNGITDGQLRDGIAKAVVEGIFANIQEGRYVHGFFFPLTFLAVFDLALNPQASLEEAAGIIANHILDSHRSKEKDKLEQPDNPYKLKDPIDIWLTRFTEGHFTEWAREHFAKGLAQAGLTMDQLEKQRRLLVKSRPYAGEERLSEAI